MKIEFNENVDFTIFNIKLEVLTRSDDWTIEDELMQLTLAIQQMLISKKYNLECNAYEWQQKINELAYQTMNKSYDPPCSVTDNKWQEIDNKYQYINETFRDKENDITVTPVRAFNYPILSKEGLEKKQADIAHKRAVKEAEQKLRLEQIKEAELEQERLELEESLKKEVVIPFKKYRADAE